MKDILNTILFLVFCAFVVLLIWIGKYLYVRLKYRKFISTAHEYGYKMDGFYQIQGKGFFMAKPVSKEILNHLLIRFNKEPINLNCKYKVSDNICLVKYPIIPYPGFVYRFFHYYSIEILEK